jgi:hypothetical protein
MRIFVPLRRRAVALLWGGQLLSSLGDEVHRVAIVWLATQLWGTAAGRLTALESLTLLLASLAAGLLVDRLSLRTVLIASDLARALAALMIPMGAALGAPLAPLLIGAVVARAFLSAAFEPALRALTVEVADAQELSVTNALMESTLRFARVLGPTLVAVLSTVIPMVQFFSVDAATFALSALSIAALSRTGVSAAPIVTSPAPVARVREALTDPALRYAVATATVVGAAWWLMLPLGITLLLHERGLREVGALAQVLFAYGCGNLASNLAVGNIADAPPVQLLHGGRLVAAAGFALFALAPSQPTRMAAAAIAAMGGPLADVGFAGLVQRACRGPALARLYRLVAALCYGAMFALFFVSPLLFRSFGPTRVTYASAAVIALCGFCGLALGDRRHAYPR